jgi:hypothetical protein
VGWLTYKTVQVLLARLQPPSAAVTIRNNANLPTSQICAFVKAIGAVNPILDVGLTCP